MKFSSNGHALGIDIGSRTTKAVVFDGVNIRSRSLIPTGWSPAVSAKKAAEEALKAAGLKEIQKVMLTGYGRVSVIDFQAEIITEITAHARGIGYLLPDTRTLIDIGGQDSKAIIVDEGGFVLDFAMNDRCAAGSGKFLEFLALTMDFDIEEFAETAFKSTSPVAISSICTVFAESEVLSLLAEHASVEDVAAGVHRSIARRVAQMAKSLHPHPPISFSGGVARNKCMLRELSKALGHEVRAPEMPEYTGALGAAIIAFEGI